MGFFLSALIPLLAGITQPLKDYFAYKAQAATLGQQISLETIKAQSAQVVAEAQASSDDLGARLSATSRDFKQSTFWLLCVPVAFSILFPQKAEVMWHNFSLMPEWFQWLFLSVYSSIWGLPIVKNGYGAITELLQARRDFKIDKIKATNDAKFFEVIRQKVFKAGMTQVQVDAMEEALKARDNEA